MIEVPRLAGEVGRHFRLANVVRPGHERCAVQKHIRLGWWRFSSGLMISLQMSPHPSPREPLPACSKIERAVLLRLTRVGLPVGTKILDAPCGAGALAASLAAAGFETWGADVQADAQAVLRERFRSADLNSRLPWPDASFEVAVSVEGIEHLENRFNFLREMRRLLRPEGLLVITTPNIVSLRSRLRFFGSGFYHRDSRPLNETQRNPLHHIGLVPFADLRYALHTSGFRLVETAHTHSKPISYAYAVYVPWMWLYTWIAFRKEKDPEQRKRNLEIRAALFSRPLLFGENLMLLARRV